jgi:inner membrane protein
MTNGGLGVAFFAPFDAARYFLPWRPIPVSPISASGFFSERGLAIMRAEVLLIWLPAAILPLVTLGWRRRGRRV